MSNKQLYYLLDIRGNEVYFRTVLVSNNHAFGRSRVRSEHDAVLRKQLFPNLGIRADPPGDTRVTQRGPDGASGRAASPARSLRTRPAGGSGPARPGLPPAAPGDAPASP